MKRCFDCTHHTVETKSMIEAHGCDIKGKVFGQKFCKDYDTKNVIERRLKKLKGKLNAKNS